MLALIIDDSSTIRRVLSSYLRPLGFGIYEAVDGQDAFELLSLGGTVPDVALIDWHMPRMNGLEFLRAIRHVPNLAGMTRIMVTSENEDGSIVRALAAGAHEYLLKPCTKEVVTERLAYLGLIRPTG